MPPSDENRARQAGKTNVDRIERNLLASFQRCDEILRVEVSASGGKGAGPPVWQTELEPGEGWVARDVAALAADAARSDAEGAGGSQTYTVSVFRMEDDSRAAATIRIRVEGGEGANPTDGTSNQVVALLTKHLDNYQRTVSLMTDNQAKNMAAMLEGVTKAYSGQLDRANKQIENLQEKHIEALILFEDLIHDRHQKELEREQVKATETRKTEAFGMLKPLVPAIMNKLSKGEVGDSPMKASVKALMDSIMPEQMDQLLAAFRPEQVALFSSMIDALEPPAKPAAPDTPATPPEAP